ncbi:unnamed protein product [Thlaspi arvense]|uniref:Uncharacterized protein n=1 Tax=Thlaspi arvense TaxID=13288 RepID=A0AAU9S4D2_THLAR|nr:unnamed protein product [Thlaspi arvense]
MSIKVYYVLMTVFLLLSTVFKIWWETSNKPRVYTTMEWLDRLLGSGTALLRVGFDEDQEYFKTSFLL